MFECLHDETVPVKTLYNDAACRASETEDLPVLGNLLT